MLAPRDRLQFGIEARDQRIGGTGQVVLGGRIRIDRLSPAMRPASKPDEMILCGQTSSLASGLRARHPAS
jgi:hypothetical protein